MAKKNYSRTQLGIKALAGDTSDVPANSEVIHWTIKNKYYTAPVHFHPIHLEGLESIDLDDVPAVIYAWNGQEVRLQYLKVLRVPNVFSSHTKSTLNKSRSIYPPMNLRSPLQLV